MQEIEKSRNLNKVVNKKKIGNGKMQEIRISRKLEKGGNHKKQEFQKSRKSEKVENWF